MDAERIQSGQTLVAAIRGVIQGRGASAGQLFKSVGLGRGGDVLELSNSIDGDYAQKVLNDSLADRLDKAFAEAGVEIDTKGLLESGLDTSPEATAKRIVDFATGFLAAFKSNNPDLEDTEQIDEFTALIKDAVEEGFEDAGKILQGIGRISAEVQGGIDKTHELVMKGIEDFADQQKKALAEQKAAAPPQQGVAKKGSLVGAV
jgi:hypothetical protein